MAINTPPLALAEANRLRRRERARLRRLVDEVWMCATDGSEVPSTKTADQLIEKVYGKGAAS